MKRWLFLFVGIFLIMLGVWMKRERIEGSSELAIDPIEAPTAPNTIEVKNKAPLHELQTLFREAHESFPTIAEVRTHRGDPHEAPDQIFDAGVVFGKIEDTLAKNNALLPQATHFYRECAERDDLISEVRALCLAHYADLSQDTEIEERFPEDVVKLSQLLFVR